MANNVNKQRADGQREREGEIKRGGVRVEVVVATAVGVWATAIGMLRGVDCRCCCCGRNGNNAAA